MANNWLSSKLYFSDGNNEKLTHYQTDTANIVDFTSAVNKLIVASQTGTIFSGTTTFENIHVTGTSALDGEVTCADDLTVEGDINLGSEDGVVVSHDTNSFSIRVSPGSTFTINEGGNIELLSYGSSSSNSTVTVSPTTMTYTGNTVFSKNLTVSGNVTSPLKLPYTTITSNSTATTIATKAGASVTISNSGGVEMTTKNDHVLAVTTDGIATIDGSQLLTKVEMMELEHPVGSIYFTLTNTNPSTILGIGTWEKIGAGMQLGIVGTVKDTNNVSHTFAAGENDDGEWRHTQKVAEMATHSHTGSAVKNGNHTHGWGDFDITGKFIQGAHDGIIAEGAFSYAGYFAGRCAECSDSRGVLNFSARDGISGSLETTGSHTHSISIDTKGGVYNSSTGKTTVTPITNVEPTFAIYLWKRTK